MKVAVLCGGRSHERAVSLRSGARVATVLAQLGHDAEQVDVGGLEGGGASERLAVGGFDVAFVALHGRGGEDGSAQAVLELLELPYTGARVGPSSAAYDKARAKRLLVAAGVSTPTFITCAAEAIEERGAGDVLEEAVREVGVPMVVKPARGGSALGTRFVSDAAALPRALVGAMSYDPHVVLERHVAGRELAVTVVGTPGSGDGPRALPAVEIVPRHADWFDYESRYSHGETEFTCPPTELHEEVLARVGQVALDTYAALDCSGFGRVDLIVDELDGTPQVLELATVPGLTDTSLIPLACAAAGLDMRDLVAWLLDDALAQALG